MELNPVQAFFTKFTKLKYTKGETILRAWDPPAGVMYIKQGFVRMSAVGKKGEMLVLHVFKAGSFFPMTWAINDTPNKYDYEAITPVEIFRAPKDQVRQLLKRHPDITQDVMSRILKGLQGLLTRMESLVLDSAYQKTVLLILYHAKNFSDTQDRKKLMIQLTHKEIAAWIGTTRETASLQIEILQKKGLITYDHRFIKIPNLEALSDEVTDTDM